MPPAQSPSITRNDSFRLRAQQSEQSRIALMIGLFAAVLALYAFRRIAGGLVMQDNAVFFGCSGVLLAAIVYEVYAYIQTRRANRESRLIPAWLWPPNAVFELAVPLTVLTIMHIYSPRGQYAALSGPSLLMLPFIIMLSVLRLRPAWSLWLGVGAAAGRLALVLHTLVSANVPAEQVPVLVSYPVILLLCGVAAALLAQVRGYVRSAAEEAAAHEREHLRLESVERDLSIARDIQRGMLPTEPPNLPGFEIAGMNRPADKTGGDYYDWQTLPDGRVVFVMADVTGHGIGPAMVMAVCRAYARASAPLIPRPEQLMERINTLVHADVHGARFITLAIAIVDAKTSSLELLSAGHGPSMLFRAADGSIEQFGGDGVPLGVLPDEQYGRARTLKMAKGDVLLLSTDGFFEWQRPSDNKAFGIPRLAQELKAHAGKDAAGIIKAIDETVCAFTEGAPQDDDMTAVVLKRL